MKIEAILYSVGDSKQPRILVDNSPENGANQKQEVIVKKTTALRASLESYKEQLRSVKDKVWPCPAKHLLMLDNQMA